MSSREWMLRARNTVFKIETQIEKIVENEHKHRLLRSDTEKVLMHMMKELCTAFNEMATGVEQLPGYRPIP
jgi:hypothetical protein